MSAKGRRPIIILKALIGVVSSFLFYYFLVPGFCNFFYVGLQEHNVPAHAGDTVVFKLLLRVFSVDQCMIQVLKMFLIFLIFIFFLGRIYRLVPLVRGEK